MVGSHIPSCWLAGGERSPVRVSGLLFGTEENALSTSKPPGLLATAPEETGGRSRKQAPEGVGRGLAPGLPQGVSLQHPNGWLFPVSWKWGLAASSGFGRVGEAAHFPPGRRCALLACSSAEKPTVGGAHLLRGPSC